jgi:hypothetical protein
MGTNRKSKRFNFRQKHLVSVESDRGPLLNKVRIIYQARRCLQDLATLGGDAKCIYYPTFKDACA